MSRLPSAALTVLGTLLLAGTAGGAAGVNPHVDRALLPRGCPSCHQGHGQPRSPMLGRPQTEVCLRCHGSKAEADAAVAAGFLSPSARPPLLATAMASIAQHPVSATAFSRSQPEVVCTSCHSPHRSAPPGRPSGAPDGTRYPSPASPRMTESELCEGCHGGLGQTTASRLDVSRFFAPTNVSYHPVEAPAAERSPSVRPELGGKFVNCTDCHGSDEPSGPRGPHGSRTKQLLRLAYTTVDGTGESPQEFALCYSCHDRKAVLEASAFPEHRRHIVEIKASCATCHNAHGSIANRALIRFGEDATFGTVGPSAKEGRLAFVSTGPGSGSCYLTCHGEDHGPESYGSQKLVLTTSRRMRAPPPEMVAVPAPPAPSSMPAPRLGPPSAPRPGRPEDPLPAPRSW